MKISCKVSANVRFLITQGEVIGHEVASIEQNLVQELIRRFLNLITHGLVSASKSTVSPAARARSTLLIRACPQAIVDSW